MNCTRFEKELIAYVDGRAGEAVRREVEKHMESCAACHTRARDFRVVWGAMDELPAIEPSDALDARLRARIAVEPQRVSFWSWALPQPRLALALTLLLMFSVWLSNRPKDPGPGLPANTEAEFNMIKDLPVLENYDVLSNFEPLSELPPQGPQGE